MNKSRLNDLRRLKEVGWKKRWRWYVEYAGYRLLKAWAQVWPLNLSSTIAAGLGRFFGHTLGRLSPLNRDLYKNLTTIFPDWPGDKIRRTGQACWAEWGRVLFEYAQIRRFRTEKDRLSIVGQEVLDQIERRHREAKPTLIVSGHFGHFQMVPLAASQVGVPIIQMYRHQSNPLVGKDFAHIQLQIVQQIAPRGVAGTKRFIKTLAEGGCGFMLIDQHIRPGLELPFLGHPALTPSGAAVLAKRLDALLVFAYTQRLGPGRFQVTFCPPTPTTGTPEEIMALLNNQLGQVILNRPEHWLWFHRRWLFSRRSSRPGASRPRGTQTPGLA